MADLVRGMRTPPKQTCGLIAPSAPAGPPSAEAETCWCSLCAYMIAAVRPWCPLAIVLVDVFHELLKPLFTLFKNL